MAKDIQQWFSKTPVHVNHPASTLKEAGKVIRARAKQLRADGDTYTAGVTQEVAARLERVAAGETWEVAFGLVVVQGEAQP